MDKEEKRKKQETLVDRDNRMEVAPETGKLEKQTREQTEIGPWRRARRQEERRARGTRRTRGRGPVGMGARWWRGWKGWRGRGRRQLVWRDNCWV